MNEVRKNVAIFVSSGVQAVFKHKGKTDAMDKAWGKYLVEKAEKYSLNPIALGLFGGVFDSNRMGYLARKTIGPFRKKLEIAGFTGREGVYDTRNWDAIPKLDHGTRPKCSCVGI